MLKAVRSCTVSMLRLERDDWEMLQAMVTLVYNAGVAAGSKQRAAEIREALGIRWANDAEKG